MAGGGGGVPETDKKNVKTGKEKYKCRGKKKKNTGKNA
jgi:hypothetical protein